MNSAAGIVLIRPERLHQEVACPPFPPPQCTLPATVIDRFILGSTTGERIEHVRISCPASHHFLAALDRLTEPDPFSAAAAAATVTRQAATQHFSQ